MSALTEYETICVFAPELQGDKLETLEKKIQKIFTQHKVDEVTKNDWGNRKLAYPIKNYKTGRYVQMIYKAPNGLIPDLERNLGYEESVLRFLTIKFGKTLKPGVQVEPTGFDVSEY